MNSWRQFWNKHPKNCMHTQICVRMQPLRHPHPDVDIPMSTSRNACACKMSRLQKSWRLRSVGPKVTDEERIKFDSVFDGSILVRARVRVRVNPTVQIVWTSKHISCGWWDPFFKVTYCSIYGSKFCLKSKFLILQART